MCEENEYMKELIKNYEIKMAEIKSQLPDFIIKLMIDKYLTMHDKIGGIIVQEIQAEVNDFLGSL